MILLSAITELLCQRDDGEQWQEQWGAAKSMPLLRGLLTPAECCLRNRVRCIS